MDRLTRLIPSLRLNGEATIRCIGCHNRIGVGVAVVLDDGAVCCSSYCGSHREVRHSKRGKGSVEIVG
jgi:hypothetical protein